MDRLLQTILDIDDEQIVFQAGHLRREDKSLIDILLSHQAEMPLLRRVVSIERKSNTVAVETRPALLRLAIAPH